MVNNTLKKSLTTLGVSQLAADYYIFILQNPNSNISKTAKGINTYRYKIYEVIKELEENEIIINDKIISPQDVLNRLKYDLIQKEKEVQDMEELVPEYLKYYKTKVSSKNSIILEGKFQFINTLNNIFENKNCEMWIVGNIDSFIRVVGQEYNQKLMSDRIKQKLSLKILIYPSLLVDYEHKDNKKDLREVRYLLDFPISKGLVFLIKDKIIFWNCDLLRAIVI
jgi:sugar-specific transcriptional regulator TrmB